MLLGIAALVAVVLLNSACPLTVWNVEEQRKDTRFAKRFCWRECGLGLVPSCLGCRALFVNIIGRLLPHCSGNLSSVPLPRTSVTRI